ncbi:MAG: DMT family transporter [Anaerolineales bacterium]|nr:DMT family transporter [Anaerolineales bacterium]MCB9127511.1 DMT family transporter [Ardenticatenales bacterium]
MLPLGELAALTTSLLWTGTSTLFTLAGQRVGSIVVNRARLVLAVLFLMLTHWLLQGELLPVGATVEQWAWLGLSGVIGLVIGDSFLFQALIWIGPQLAMLMLSLAPVIAALAAWLFLGETLTAPQTGGVLLTVGGVAWVVLQRNRPTAHEPAERNFLMGILFGLGAALGQALGLITAKVGLQGEFSALSGTLIRMLVAMAVVWLITIARGQAGPTLRRLQSNRPAIVQLVGAALFGPFLGVWLSLVAIQHTAVGIASTLMALPPVFLLPVARYLFRETVSWQAVAGTIVAMIGVGVLFLS